jgi:YNFM family putative membrane transporter
VLAAFLCGAFAFLEVYCTQPLLPMLQRLFHTTEAHVGLTISACTTGVALSAALLALFGEGLARKRTIVLSLIAVAVIGLLTATATSLNGLALWRLAQGIVTPGIFIITIAYITEEWAPHQIPRVMSFYVAGTVFGGFSGRFLGGFIAQHFNWHLVFVVLGLLGLAGAGLIARLLPPSRDKLRITNAHLLAETLRAAAAPQVAPLQQVVRNLRSMRLLATFAIGFCMLFTLVATFNFVTFYLDAAPFFLSASQLSALFAVYLIGLAATIWAGGVLTRVGLREGMLAATACCMVGIALTLIHSLLMIGVGLAVLSSGVFIAQTCAASFLRDAAPLGSRVSATGMYICSYYIGGTVGGVLPALAFRHFGWPGCVGLIVFVQVSAAVLTALGWRPLPKADPIPL